jgi:hypothetical protein
MKLIHRIHSVMLYPAARIIVGAQSEYQRVKTLGKSTKIHFEEGYDGQPIMLLALYQKGRLRPDLIRLLRAAKAQGLYVLGVNTLKLQKPEELRGLIDCYIERSNFGRDFGSYKTGFLHLFSRRWEGTCPRLVMLNDSVFYASRGLDKFIDELATSRTEVLGGTENYEIEYHLGSFCISMAQSVLKADRFKAYWKGYRLTDVRPVVIKRGEMKLSKTLKRCVSMPSEFRALYSSDRFLNEIKSNPDLQDLVIKDSRTGANTPAPRFGAESVTKMLAGRFIARRYSLGEKVDISIDTPVKELNEEVLITSREDFSRYLLRHVPEQTGSFDEIFSDSLAAVASEVFMLGSQIHQNAAVLLEIGLPIIKLDGLYRGMFNNYDVLRLQKKLNETEARELSALLLDRPYGGQMLYGWKRAAFLRGLI